MIFSTIYLAKFWREGVNIDLLFAKLNSSSVPKNFDINNDAVLDGVDTATACQSGVFGMLHCSQRECLDDGDIGWRDRKRHRSRVKQRP